MTETTRRIGKYLSVRLDRRPSGRVTDRWTVESNYGDELGIVSWYTSWRCYVFDPSPRTTFNSACLADIAAFLAASTLAHRQAKVTP